MDTARRPPPTSLVIKKTSKRINQYSRIKTLHSKHGSTEVMLCDDEERGRQVVVKAVKRMSKKDRMPRNPTARNDPPSSQQSIDREIAILKSCNHMCSVELLEVIDDPSAETVYIALEYLSGGPVQWEKEKGGRPPLTLEQSRRIIRDVTVGLEYLHYHGIIHRDIKPGNIIWSADRTYVKIIDYGISHFSESRLQVPRPHTHRFLDPLRQCPAFKDSDLQKVRGTGYFYAPEVIWLPPDTATPLSSFESIPPSSDISINRPPITPAVDVWCLGITSYCLFFGVFPFQPPREARNSPYALNRVILQGDWVVDETMYYERVPTGGRESREMPGHVLNMLDRMLQKDPAPRISIPELKRHPWLLEGIHDADNWLIQTAPATQYRRPSSLPWLRRPISAIQSLLSAWA